MHEITGDVIDSKTNAIIVSSFRIAEPVVSFCVSYRLECVLLFLGGADEMTKNIPIRRMVQTT